MEAAVIQLYSLLVFPHLGFGSYGTDISEDLTGRLIVAGVDMFLGFYASAQQHGGDAPVLRHPKPRRNHRTAQPPYTPAHGADPALPAQAASHR